MTNLPKFSHLFGRVMPVVFLSPQFCVHLQSNILKVDVSVDVIDVVFRHIVQRVLPVPRPREVRQLLSANTRIVLLD